MDIDNLLIRELKKKLLLLRSDDENPPEMLQYSCTGLNYRWRKEVGGLL